MSEQPRFKHDCNACAFLGEDGARDLYFCDIQPGLPTVIARYGDHGPDYVSGLVARTFDSSLGIAFQRAVAAGHLPVDAEIAAKVKAASEAESLRWRIQGSPDEPKRYCAGHVADDGVVTVHELSPDSKIAVGLFFDLRDHAIMMAGAAVVPVDAAVHLT